MKQDTAGNTMYEPISNCSCGSTGGCSKCNPTVFTSITTKQEDNWKKEVEDICFHVYEDGYVNEMNVGPDLYKRFYGDRIKVIIKLVKQEKQKSFTSALEEIEKISNNFDSKLNDSMGVKSACKSLGIKNKWGTDTFTARIGKEMFYWYLCQKLLKKC